MASPLNVTMVTEPSSFELGKPLHPDGLLAPSEQTHGSPCAPPHQPTMSVNVEREAAMWDAGSPSSARPLN